MKIQIPTPQTHKMTCLQKYLQFSSLSVRSDLGLSQNHCVIAVYLITGCSHTDLGFLNILEKMYFSSSHLW